MRALKHVLMGLLMLVLLVMALGQTPSTASKPTILAVIDTGRLYTSLDEMNDVYRDVEIMKTEATREIEKRRAELERLNTDIDNPTLFKKESQEMRKMQEDLLKQTLDLQSFTQFSQQRLFMELQVRTLLVHNHINDAIAAYARAHGIVIVFTTEDTNLSRTRNQQELQTALMMRKIAFYDGAYDITVALIQQMNASYKLGTIRPKPTP
jgi:Skp family chaperone for outer membrane proteins